MEVLMEEQSDQEQSEQREFERLEEAYFGESLGSRGVYQISAAEHQRQCLSANSAAGDSTGLRVYAGCHVTVRMLVPLGALMEGRSVVELGCGVGVLGLLSCLIATPKRLLLTDGEERAMHIIRRNIPHVLSMRSQGTVTEPEHYPMPSLISLFFPPLPVPLPLPRLNMHTAPVVSCATLQWGERASMARALRLLYDAEAELEAEIKIDLESEIGAGAEAGAEAEAEAGAGTEAEAEAYDVVLSCELMYYSTDVGMLVETVLGLTGNRGILRLREQGGQEEGQQEQGGQGRVQGAGWGLWLHAHLFRAPGQELELIGHLAAAGWGTLEIPLSHFVSRSERSTHIEWYRVRALVSAPLDRLAVLAAEHPGWVNFEETSVCEEEWEEEEYGAGQGEGEEGEGSGMGEAGGLGGLGTLFS
ncbi:hypothetical protein B484DRAFT_455641 [Ochromonadaceae sp. CCMP2298]|nr:hypothetical protein B484DRAFT_455641 [Ochromonadaceae sp. CCMP2298]